MRTCYICKKPFFAGMTDDYGTFYAHEGSCFETYMDNMYGKHQWMSLGDNNQDDLGGYYIASSDDGNGYRPTGIYYTEYYDKNDTFLYELLREHAGHKVEIAEYGNGDHFALEDLDTNEVIFDTDCYELIGREVD